MPSSILGLLFILGVATGGFSNITGSGGGAFTIYLLSKYASLTVQQSVGTELAASTVIIFVGAMSFYRIGVVNTRLALTLGLSGASSAFFTSRVVSSSIQSTELGHAFGAFTLAVAAYSAYNLIRWIKKGNRDERIEPRTDRTKDKELGFSNEVSSSTPSESPVVPSGLGFEDQSRHSKHISNSKFLFVLQIGLGASVGVATALFGVGGSELTLAALVTIFRQSPRVALGTSLLTAFFRYAAGSAGYLSAGQVNLPVLLVLVIGGVAGSIVGARIILQNRALRQSKGQLYLRAIVILLLFFVSYQFLFSR